MAPGTRIKITRPLKEKAFANTIETRIASKLWGWSLGTMLVEDDCPLDTLVEFYLCVVFEQVTFTRKRGIWCDGVDRLEIEQINRRAFRIIGIGYFPNDLAPFEIDFHFKNRRDEAPTTEIVRFGELDPRGELRQRKYPLLSQRPSRNQDWAVAVELTPKPDSDANPLP